MPTLKEIASISEDRYIEIKKLAYTYYKEYSLLDKSSRRNFLIALPKLNNSFEDDILINTLLFPDTKKLISLEGGQLQNALGRIVRNEDIITAHNIITKVMEYSSLNTKALIQTGKLEFMDEISLESSVDYEEYKELKKSAITKLDEFNDLSLGQKTNLIIEASKIDTYQARIQLSTMLIPNDRMLMKQLKTASIADVASYYMVPESLISFKIEEYNKQGTETLLNDGMLPEVKSSRLWYRDSLADSMEMINKLWDQSFYRRVENSNITKVNDVLDDLFGDSSQKSPKQENVK